MTYEIIYTILGAVMFFVGYYVGRMKGIELLNQRERLPELQPKRIIQKPINGMIFCPRCGKETDATGAFCQWCGWDVSEITNVGIKYGI
jgi:hypothetical protein